MKNVLRAAGLCAAAGLVAAAAEAQNSPGRANLPDNVRVVAAQVQPLVAELYALSDTFRRQCDAIGRSRNVLVTVGKPVSPLRDHSHPRLSMRRYDSGMILAHIEVPPLVRPEFLAHQFERVLQQLDRNQTIKAADAAIRAKAAERATRHEMRAARVGSDGRSATRR